MQELPRDPALERAEVAIQEGAFELAIAQAHAALLRSPESLDAFQILGVAHLQRKEIELARTAFEAVARLGHGDPLFQLGRSLAKREQWLEALACFESLVPLFPNNGALYYEQGVVLHKLERRALAEQAYREALARWPGDPRPYVNLGVLQFEVGLEVEALETWRLGLEVDGHHVPLLENLGELLARRNDHTSAIDAFRRLLELQPNRDDIKLSLGVELGAVGEFDDALDLFESLYPTHSSHPLVLENLGRIYVQERRFAEAQDLLERVLEIRPAPEAASALATSYAAQMQSDRAIALLEESALRWPHSACLMVEASLHLPAMLTECGEAAAVARRFERGMDDLESLVETDTLDARALLETLDQRSNFYLSYLDVPVRALHERYGRLHTRLAERIEGRFEPIPTPVEGRRIRVGYISTVIKDHVIARLIKGYLEHHDQEQFEVHLFHAGKTMDAYTEKLKSMVHRFHHVFLPHQDVADQVRAAQLDVLIHIDIGMDSFSQGLAARRLAPVQATSFCHPVTSGYPNIDYFVAPEAWEEPNSASSYSEQLALLPGNGVCFERSIYAKPGTASRAEFRLPEDELIFLVPKSPFKFLPEYDSVYAEILKRAPGHMVFLKGDQGGLADAFERRMRRAFQATSVDPERLHFLSFMSRDAFARLHMVGDILLDSLPFSSFVSTMEALAHAPIPMVARRADQMRYRAAAGLSQQAGCSQWVAKDRQDFIDKAVQLAESPQARATARTILERTRVQLFGRVEPVRALESHIRKWVRSNR